MHVEMDVNKNILEKIIPKYEDLINSPKIDYSDILFGLYFGIINNTITLKIHINDWDDNTLKKKVNLTMDGVFNILYRYYMLFPNGYIY